MQTLLFESEQSNWTPPALADLPSWKGVKRIGFDTETRDEHLSTLGPGVRRGAYMVGISFAIEGGKSYYLPFRHQSGGNLPEDNVLAYIRDQAKDFDGMIVTANGPYDYDFCEEQNIVFPKAVKRDIQVGATLVNENHYRFSVDAIAKRYGIKGKDETLLRKAASMYRFGKVNKELTQTQIKGNLWRMHSKYVGPYAEYDAFSPLEIQRKIEADIEKQNLHQIYQLESDIMPITVKMQRRGVRINEDRLEQIRLWSYQEQRACLKRIRHTTGVNIHHEELNNKTAIAPALEAIGVKLELTEKTSQPRIDKDVLYSIDHHVARDLIRARKMDKLRNTFVKSIRRHMTNGRIHSTFNQLRRAKEDAASDGLDRGPRYGRMSSEHPNVQQQPARDDFAAMWRSIYLPDHDGQLWLAADYSQQEPRLLTHYAELSHLKGATEAADRYREDPNTDNHQMMADLCGLPRKAAKTIYLGLCYGMGGGKLAVSLGLPTVIKMKRNGHTYLAAGPEAQAILDQFNSRAPYVKGLSNKCQEFAEGHGYIRTILGRILHFESNEKGVYLDAYKAANKIIQGSAGDQTKLAMVQLDRAGLCPQIQVHDEVGMSVDTLAQVREVGRIMVTGVKLQVPSVVDLEASRSWGETDPEASLGGFVLKAAA